MNTDIPVVRRNNNKKVNLNTNVHTDLTITTTTATLVWISSDGYAIIVLMYVAWGTRTGVRYQLVGLRSLQVGGADGSYL